MGEIISDKAICLTIKGLVQGIGFRPFIFRLAKSLSLKGWVKNTNDAVYIHVQGSHFNVDDFIQKVYSDKPSVAKIESINIEQASVEALDDFVILKSSSSSNEVTSVSPDIAVCEECLDDMQHQSLRIKYPLVNCCHCGPRFSIVKELPYDRANTTMAEFAMCKGCEEEYNNPLDRRFHAQPVACNQCGPVYRLSTNIEGKRVDIFEIDEILNHIKDILQSDGIIVFKGTGGFHLVCNALSEKAVSRLRKLKQRDRKPFAVIFRDIESIKEYAFLSEKEEEELKNFRRPIVILDQKKPLATSVNYELNTIGAMLPYMPFHYLVFKYITANSLIMTSGNFSDEPVIIENNTALHTFIHQVDAVLTYNREIHNRLDDSVVRVINNKASIIRRSRGYVPENILLDNVSEGILATGAELTGTFAIGKGNAAIMSQYCGDLQNVENFNFYQESYSRFAHLFRFQPRVIAYDLHPDYISTRYAQKFDIEKISVQHHHAHIASVVAEHNIMDPVIGVAFDGTGLGIDNYIWGSEFLICSGYEFERAFHFEYTPLPGGDKVITEPWRTAMGQLFHYFGKEILNDNISFLSKIDPQKRKLIEQALEKKINLSYSCSAGRLFDAVAAVTEVCIFPKSHAEAPMQLESIIDKTCSSAYSFSFEGQNVSLKLMWEELLKDLKQMVPISVISAKFHNCIAHIIAETCVLINKKNQLNTVALSGGTFQNKYLLEKTLQLLEQLNFRVYVNEKVPCNDGGIALGQLYLVSKMKNLKK